MSSQWRDKLAEKGRLMLLTLSALVTIAIFVLVVAAYARPNLTITRDTEPNPTLVVAAQTPQKPTDASLAGCPARKPALRIAGHFNEEFTPHPAENRFGSIHYTRLHQMPLFGADPQEENVAAAFGIAEAWEFLPGAKGLIVTLREGLSFNNGDPITAEDVVFSINLSASDYAEDQIKATLKGIGVTAKVVDKRKVRIEFAKGAPTFVHEMSPLVFPIYVTSRKYHSDGVISQEAFDRFRKNPLAAGPYRVVDRQAQRFITLEAARKDPLLGCPVYSRIEIRNIGEFGTRFAQLRTGQLDIIEGSRDLLDRATSIGARPVAKPAAHMIGLYLFQTWHKQNVFHDERVRKAAAHAIDHKLITKTIWRGIGVTTWGCTWPPSTEVSTMNPKYVEACATPYPYDPDKARELLAAAGYSKGRVPSIKLVYWNNYPEEADFAQAIQPMLEKVGFKVTIDPIDRAEYARRRKSGEGYVDSILFFGPGGRITSLAGSYSVWGPTENWGPKHDQDVVDALTAASRAGSLEEYTDATAKLGKLVHDRAYGPGFFASSSLWFVGKNVPNWGLEKSRGRAPLNLAALVTQR
ncbi:MAG TPA: ABC transporter substrate-binding protein [Candidatus Binatia bacterium]